MESIIIKPTVHKGGQVKMDLTAGMEWRAGIMFAFVLALAGCATTLPRYPSNADLLVVASKAACGEIVLNNGRVTIGKETKMALVDLNAVHPASGANQMNVLVRDAFVEELSARAIVLEREAPIFNRVARESMPSLSGTVVADSRAGARGIQENSGEKSRTEVKGKFNLPTADYLLTYRVLDMGVQYRKISDKELKRDAQLYLYYELVDAKTGQVARAERIRMSATDSIDPRAKGDVEKSGLAQFGFPMPTTGEESGKTEKGKK